MSSPPPLPGPRTPGQGLPEVVPGQLPERPESSRPASSVVGDVVRTGRWEAARRTVDYRAVGNLKLDLREVLVPGETLEVRAYLGVGDVRILVPPGTDVEVHGMTLIGDGRKETDAFGPARAPTGARLVVRAFSMVGKVRVRAAAVDAKLPRGWRWARAARSS